MTKRPFLLALAVLAVVAALVAPVEPAGAAGLAGLAGDAGEAGEAVRIVVTGETLVTGANVAAATGGAGHVVDAVPAIGMTVVEVPATRVGSARRALARLAGVDDVRRDGVAHADEVIPSDPSWAAQAAAMQSIGAPRAWAASTGSSAVTIAVVDTGVTETPDLDGRVLPGWDVVNGDADPTDDDGHGTASALVAAAAGNDGTGTAGLCWSCLVLPVKVLDDVGSGTMSDVAAGIVWAVDHGADVVNLSLGGDSNEPSVAAAVRYALDRDVVVVASAGNDGRSEPNFPAAAEGVISVGGLAADGRLDPASRRGPTWVDLGAPFCNWIAPYVTAYSFCGTSSSAPLVTGTAALLRGIRPGADRSMVSNALFTTAVFAPTAGAVGYGTLDAGAAASAIGGIGPGPVIAPPDVTNPTVSADFPGGYTHDIVRVAVASADDQRVAATHLTVGPRLVAAVASPAPVQPLDFDTRAFGDGTYTVSADVVDGAGHTATTTGSITIDNAPPLGLLTSPTSGSTQTGSFVARVVVADPNGVMGTFLVANGKVVGGFTGNGWGEARVPISRSGKVTVVALTVDNAGHIAGTNSAVINARVGRRHR